MDIEEKPSDTEWTPIAKISILCIPLLRGAATCNTCCTIPLL